MPYTITNADNATIRALYTDDPATLTNAASSAMHFGFTYAVRGSNRGIRVITTDDSTDGIRGWIPGVIVDTIHLTAIGEYVELMYDTNWNVWQVTARHTPDTILVNISETE